MAGAFLANKILKRLCRVIYYSSTVSLVLLFIYVYYTSQVISTLKISDAIKINTVAFPATKEQNMACSDNTFSTPEGCLPCPNGTFNFSGWSECEPLLNCSNIALHVHPRKRIFGSFTKQIWLADWKSHQVIYMNCSRPFLKTKCLRGMTRLEQLQGPYVTRLIGRCYDKLEVSYMILFIIIWYGKAALVVNWKQSLFWIVLSEREARMSENRVRSHSALDFRSLALRACSTTRKRGCLQSTALGPTTVPHCRSYWEYRCFPRWDASLGGERHCESKVSCPRTRHNCRVSDRARPSPTR